MSIAAERRPWKAATLWLIALGALFFSSYNAANWLASQRADVPSIVFAWESHVPYWPWTIVPYWSIDLFYCISLFICCTRAELSTQALRLLTVQIISVVIFVAAPLRCTFVRPETSGVFGMMLDALLAFDKPFNQAPALHISLLVILWARFALHLSGVWRWLLHMWFALIAISVMTTYQHQFFDIPTGAWVGLLCVWLFPEGAQSLLRRLTLTRDVQRRRLALRYWLASVAAGTIAVAMGGAWLCLLWMAGSLILVALNYACFGAAGFQKSGNGRMTLAARLLLAPYLAGAWINSRWWTRHAPQPCAITPHVWLGRLPRNEQDLPSNVRGIVDLCAELPCSAQTNFYTYVPALDLVALTPEQLTLASSRINDAVDQGPALVCCALGYSRSAAAVAAWLLITGKAASVVAAVATLRTAKPGIVLTPTQLAALDQLPRRS